MNDDLEDSDFDEEELQLRRKLEELENTKEELSAEDLLLMKMRKVHEANKFWAPVLLLFPISALCVAITTIVIGGLILNIASQDCNAHLGLFLLGSVILSYVLILFNCYVWLYHVHIRTLWGYFVLKPIRTLLQLKVFYGIYGTICLGWWTFGTSEMLKATHTTETNTGCAELSPALYYFSQYQIAIFWIFLLVIFLFGIKVVAEVMLEKDRARKSRIDTLRQEMETKLIAEAKEMEDREEELRLEEEEEERIHLEQEERDRLYGSDDEGTDKKSKSKKDTTKDNEDEEDQDDDSDDSDDEDDDDYDEDDDNYDEGDDDDDDE